MYICKDCNSLFEEPTVEVGCNERLGYEIVDFCPYCHSVDFEKLRTLNSEMFDTNVDLLKQVGKITMTDYLSNPDSCMEDMLGSALEELLKNYDDLSDEFEDYQKRVEQERFEASLRAPSGYYGIER